MSVVAPVVDKENPALSKHVSKPLKKRVPLREQKNAFSAAVTEPSNAGDAVVIKSDVINAGKMPCWLCAFDKAPSLDGGL